MSDTNQNPSPDPNRACRPDPDRGTRVSRRVRPSPTGPPPRYGSTPAPRSGPAVRSEPSPTGRPSPTAQLSRTVRLLRSQGGYQQPAYPPAPQSGYVVAQPYGALPEHPQGTTILVLGIVGLFVTICAPIAWYMGSKAQKEIAASGQHYSNEQNINIGKIMGMVLSILAIVGIVIAIIFIVIAVIAGVASSELSRTTSHVTAPFRRRPDRAPATAAPGARDRSRPPPDAGDRSGGARRARAGDLHRRLRVLGRGGAAGNGGRPHRPGRAAARRHGRAAGGRDQR